MNTEFKAYVKANKIDNQLAKSVFENVSEECKSSYGDLATDFVINRNAMFKLGAMKRSGNI